ncbi:hypothetical protein D3C81_1604820 [compost metagenome]
MESPVLETVNQMVGICCIYRTAVPCCGIDVREAGRFVLQPQSQGANQNGRKLGTRHVAVGIESAFRSPAQDQTRTHVIHRVLSPMRRNILERHRVRDNGVGAVS